MTKENVKRYTVLGILFFLPVAFLLLLLPAKHHYIPLDIVKYQVNELSGFYGEQETIKLEDHISVVGFWGLHPMEESVSASNIKEMIYDKFKGFKKFQVVIVVPSSAKAEAEKLKAEISSYEELTYFYLVYGSPSSITSFYSGLKTQQTLNSDLATDEVFIVDKDLNQRGRLDDREEKEKANNKPSKELTSYNTIKIAELKNKFGDDFRVLFQEYREKRKGTFQSSDERRAYEIKPDHEQD
ncbi:MAG TPA: hypothetical protein PLZ00_08630 [Mangrovimonas sp.]|nr:hypothetical protein [Mangrovimonas sp.]